MGSICCPTTMVTNCKSLPWNIAEEQRPQLQHSRSLKSHHFQRFPQLVYFKNIFTQANLSNVCLIIVTTTHILGHLVYQTLTAVHTQVTFCWPGINESGGGRETFLLLTYTDNQHKNGEVAKICTNSPFPQYG